MKHSFTQLLVHLDGTRGSEARLALARSIAADHDAALTCLYAVTPAILAVPYAPEAGASVIAALREIDDERRSRVRKTFDAQMATPGARAAWAEVLDDPVISGFARQALYADLLVLGQHEDADPDAAGVPPDFPEAVMAACGKPALVLPYQMPPGKVGQTVLVAWKPTREAARAVSAAVPLLQRARKVHVMTWAAEDEAVAGVRLDLDGYLRLRGIEPVWHKEGGSEPDFLGELLLSRAFDLEADLMVMGCYGHSRAREWVLGGTSRTVLRSMTLPVLMAH